VIELVLHILKREDNVTCGEKVDRLAVAACGGVESSGAPSVPSGEGSDAETECCGERTANAGGWVCNGDVVEEPRAGPPEERLMKRYLDDDYMKPKENLLVGEGRDLGEAAGE
jgi:hypothetical protein